MGNENGAWFDVGWTKLGVVLYTVMRVKGGYCDIQKNEAAVKRSFLLYSSLYPSSLFSVLHWLI
jgi:hypothetical protein